MRNIRFQIGERVKLKGTNRTGEVRAYKIDGYLIDGKLTEVIQYQVNMGSYYNENIVEEKLEPLHSYNFDNKFEAGLKNFLTDLYLKHGKLDVVKLLSKNKHS